MLIDFIKLIILIKLNLIYFITFEDQIIIIIFQTLKQQFTIHLLHFQSYLKISINLLFFIIIILLFINLKLNQFIVINLFIKLFMDQFKIELILMRQFVLESIQITLLTIIFILIIINLTVIIYQPLIHHSPFVIHFILLIMFIIIHFIFSNLIFILSNFLHPFIYSKELLTSNLGIMQEYLLHAYQLIFNIQFSKTQHFLIPINSSILIFIIYFLNPSF